MQEALRRIAGERFEVLETWQGGQGTTAAVRERASGALRVLKVFGAREDLREGSLLASLSHPAIPRVLELGTTTDGTSYLVREFAAGVPLGEDLPLAVPEVVELATQLLLVLGYVHLRGVLHLDLKPANVLRGGTRDAPHYVLLDFGLGARGGDVVAGGTPFFVSPELMLGAIPDPRSDLFSLGVLLHTALRGGTSKLPLARFLARFPQEDFFQALGEAPPDVPERLRAFLQRLVARAPGDRYPDAQAALDALRGTGSGRPSPQQLTPDPIAIYGGALRTLLQKESRTVVLRGGAPDDRAALALHASAECRVRATAHGESTTLAPEHATGRAVDFELRPLDLTALERHLAEVASLSQGAAAHAARELLREAPRGPAATGMRLRELVEAGAIVPNGPRWVWPDAEAMRPLGRAANELAAQPAAIRGAASRGAFEAAQRAYARGSTAAHADERTLREALVLGFLEAGEPARALSLAHDLPLARVRALLDLGRVREAEAERAAAERVATPRELRQLALAFAFAKGELAAAEPIARALADAEGRVIDRVALASVLARQGEGHAAEPMLEADLAAARAEQPFLAAVSLANLAELRRARGDLAAARAAGEEAIHLFAGLGHVRHIATATMNLGVIQKDLGDYEAALTSQRRALGLFEHLKDRRGVAVCRANLGVVSLARADVATAVRDLAEAESELVELGATEILPKVREFLAKARDADRAPEAPPGAAATTKSCDDARTMHESADRGVPREVFRTFLAINRRLAGEASLERAMRSLLEAAINLTGGRNGYLLISGQDGIRLEFRTGDTDEGIVAFSRSLVNRALQQRTTLTSAEAMLDKQILDMPSVRDLRTRSAVCVPFRSASGVEGALYVDHPGRAGVFGPLEKEHLEVLGDQAAIAVDRMLHEERVAKELAESRRELAVVKRSLRSPATMLVGKSKPMQELARQIEKVAQSTLAVLVQGATGTGKELVARRIHELSQRARGPFVSENCSAIPAELMESELFGHVKGAFTGADQDRPGLLELASGGTLFLDEVGDMPSQLQPKLLRALQEGSIRRVGGKETIPVDLRLVAATHKDLKKMIAESTFREDLYFRIAAVQIRVPPLRERGGDIVLLAEEFLSRLNRQHSRNVTLSATARDALVAYPWPGNVRELEHVIARAFLLLEGEELDEMHLPEVESGGTLRSPGAAADEWPAISLGEAEARTIRAALRHTAGDKTKAARLLEISRTALYEKLKRIEAGKGSPPAE